MLFPVQAVSGNVAEMCLVCKELSSADSPSWDAGGENGARAIPPGLMQLWISSWCWHRSIPIKETLLLAGLQFLQSWSLFRGGSEFSSAALVPGWTRMAERLKDVTNLSTWLSATAAGPSPIFFFLNSRICELFVIAGVTWHEKHSCCLLNILKKPDLLKRYKSV